MKQVSSIQHTQVEANSMTWWSLLPQAPCHVIYFVMRMNGLLRFTVPIYHLAKSQPKGTGSA